MYWPNNNLINCLLILVLFGITFNLVILLCSECLCDQDPGDRKYLRVSCFQFFLHASISTELPESTVVHLITSIFPILLETIIKGKRIHIDTLKYRNPRYLC
jgi:hypothetical protein